MTRESFDERRNALEEEFFRRQNAELTERLRSERQRAEAREAMRSTSGITDEAVLDRLIDEGLTPASVAAVSLAPLVAVAWADRKLDEKERRAVLDEAAKSGLTAETAGYELLENWLGEAPPPSLLAAWAEYVRALASTMDPGARREFRESLVGRAKAVATAAGGGFAGLGSKVSDAEQAVLRSVEDALAD